MTTLLHSFIHFALMWVTSLFWTLPDTHWPITIVCRPSLDMRINSISQSGPWGPNNQNESIKTQIQYFDAWRVTRSAVIIYRKIYKAEKLQSFASCAPVCSTNTELTLKRVILPPDTHSSIWWGNLSVWTEVWAQDWNVRAKDWTPPTGVNNVCGGSGFSVRPACLCALWNPQFQIPLFTSFIISEWDQNRGGRRVSVFFTGK